MKTRVIAPLDVPEIVVSDNAACLSARILENYIMGHVTKLQTLLAYAPMSSGRAERMVGITKHFICRLVNCCAGEWDSVAGKAVFGYGRRLVGRGLSFLDLCMD